MNKASWHKLLVRLGRLVPPVERLHNDRNALAARLTASEQELARLASELESVRDIPPQNNSLPIEITKPELHFDYSYFPRVRSWDGIRDGNIYRRMLESENEMYRALLSSFLDYTSAFSAIPAQETSDERQPNWTNPWLPMLDAICMSGLITKLNPRRYVEVGSGNSTKYVRRAINDHKLRTRIISIDPEPRAVIDELCDKVIRDKLESCDLSIFADLGPEDVVFIDNSHRSFQNSDVTVFFTEVLPLLKSGCHYGIHDIFLPYDYPVQWLSRFYNEQYLLMSYLLGGANGDEIVLPVHYVERTPALLATLDPLLNYPPLRGIMPLGGAFWMKRR